MQATVRFFDAATASGTVLLDDGSELPYGRDAFAGSGVRLLRSGQRVRIELASDGGTSTGAGGTDGTGRRVVFLTIATLPDRR